MKSLQRGSSRIKGEIFKYLPGSTCDSVISLSSGASGPGSTTAQASSLILTVNLWKAHPVQVEQEDGEHRHGRAERASHHSQTQDEEELRLRPQSATVSGDGRSANTKPNK